MTVLENMGFALKLRKVAEERDRGAGRRGGQGGLEIPEDRSTASRGGSGLRNGSRWAGRSSATEGVTDGRTALEPGRQVARCRCGPRSASCSDVSGPTFFYVTHDQAEAMLGDRIAVMAAASSSNWRDARALQHAGEPLRGDLHWSPQMNFMPGELRDGRVQTPLGEIPLPEAARARAGDATGEVIVGIRPESFEDASVVSRDVSDRGMTFKAKIDLVESLGGRGVRLLRSPRHPGRLGSALRACGGLRRPRGPQLRGRAGGGEGFGGEPGQTRPRGRPVAGHVEAALLRPVDRREPGARLAPVALGERQRRQPLAQRRLG